MQADADAVLELAGLDLGVAAEHADASAGARAQSLEDFDGGGLAGAVGAEQAEDFAGAHFEIDALDGREAAVALGEGFHLDGIVHEFFSLSQDGRSEPCGVPQCEAKCAHCASAARVERSVFARLSFGKSRMIGSTIQPRPVGTSRVSEIASHSSHVPPSRSSNRQ